MNTFIIASEKSVSLLPDKKASPYMVYTCTVELVRESLIRVQLYWSTTVLSTQSTVHALFTAVSVQLYSINHCKLGYCISVTVGSIYYN